MAYTITDRQLLNLGSKNGAEIELNITSYVTGGEDVSGATLGLASDPIILIATPIAATPGVMVTWDKANKKLKLFTATAAELANANVFGKLRLLVIGGAA